LPDPDGKHLDPPGDLVNPLVTATRSLVEKHTFELAHLADVRLHALRGWVRQIGFVFTLTIQEKPDGDSHPLHFRYDLDNKKTKEEKEKDKDKPKDQKWHVPKKLIGKKNEPLPPLFADLQLMPPGQKKVDVVARGLLLTDEKLGPMLKILSLDVAAPSARVDTRGVPMRWALDIEGIDG